MHTLIILNDPPYGTERVYNGLRLANALGKNAPGGKVTVFLMGDAVLSARTGQKTPDGYYNVEKMLKRLIMAVGESSCVALAWTRAGFPPNRCSKVPSAAPWTPSRRRRLRLTRSSCSEERAARS